jgi:hypothetical protein
MNVKFSVPLLLSSTLLFFSCKKAEGPGGSSTISGVLSTQLFNKAGTKTGEYPKADEDVYIIYGEGNTVYDDKATTSYDGSFQFKYLERGYYTVYYYEDCASCLEGKQAKLISTTIPKNRSDVDLGILEVIKIKNTGSSQIKGHVHVMNYNNTGVFVNEGAGPDEDVYLVYGNGTAYSEKVKTDYNGDFAFPYLGMDHYKVYVYSKCTTCASGVQAVLVETDVTAENSTVDLGVLTINK